MKKLFFLCVFLFVSMQMSAQMYIVSYNSSASVIFETIIDPDGNTYYNTIFSGTKEEYKQDPKILVLKAINSTLNEIMKNGYTLLETDALDSHALFFSESPKLDPAGDFREPVFYLVKK